MAEEALTTRIIRYPLVIIGSLIVVLVLISALLLQKYGWIDVVTNSTDIFLFVIALPLLSFAFGLIIRGLTKHSTTTRLEPQEKQMQTLATTPEPIYSHEQERYRKAVRDDLIRIRQELNPPNKERRAIQFQSWNAFTQPDPRPDGINNPDQFKATESFSTVLNSRNDHLNDTTLDDDCIVEYVKIRKTRFLDVHELGAAEIELKKEQMRLDAEVKKTQIHYDSIKSYDLANSPATIATRGLTAEEYRKQRMKVYDAIITSLENEKNTKPLTAGQLRTYDEILQFIREKQLEDLRG